MFCPLVALLMADMASPDDVHSCACERSRQAGSLRIVKENDVARSDEADYALGVSVSDPHVVGCLVSAEFTLVAGSAVQVIMDPLGYSEELGVPAQNQPMHITSGVERVANEHLEHFGDASA